MNFPNGLKRNVVRGLALGGLCLALAGCSGLVDRTKDGFVDVFTTTPEDLA